MGNNTNQNSPQPQNSTAKMVYTLVVHLYAKDDAESIRKLVAKLQEASQVYSNDKETLGWFVMQDHKDPRAFTIVERYENEGSQKYHLENPYWQTFDKYGSRCWPRTWTCAASTSLTLPRRSASRRTPA